MQGSRRILSGYQFATLQGIIASHLGDKRSSESSALSRVVLVDVFAELRNYGFDVRLGFIQVDLV